MRNDPTRREPRAPAVAVWTLFGVLVGVAGGILFGSFLLPVVVGTGLGLLFGLFTTRKMHLPDE
ncbi:hypothetical protein [Nakamurella multipartita]|jgi:hypothetical protein|uniref:Uncharacterized protein n=1 Tax=Nakamurella multipartita (strain ATCC 700099 / DSM 44233 / CIP 104796 / JCM 9543 / NBRC 105858 / Y-104) TaxID=479431 RepID=C8XJI8_NAKMY|nr:hypothetical protein [Nakamurella multipartita]ACV80549.1 hypothetical protein Namu_4260 [Nakamurella multipartita DSM 44233]HOZ56643.1 hypothetical protein [Nakamurella multipartita]